MKSSAACLLVFSPRLATAPPETSTEVRPLVIETYAIDPNRLEVSRELRKLDESIENARDTGRLSKSEAKKARKQVGIIAREANLATHDGLSDIAADSLAVSARGVESLVNAPIRPD